MPGRNDPSKVIMFINDKVYVLHLKRPALLTHLSSGDSMVVKCPTECSDHSTQITRFVKRYSTVVAGDLVVL